MVVSGSPAATSPRGGRYARTPGDDRAAARTSRHELITPARGLSELRFPARTPRGDDFREHLMGSVIKKRRKRMAKKKHRKLLKKTRVQRRNKK